MQEKKRPQYIEKQLREVNDYFRNNRLKFEDKYNDTLFCWFTTYLSSHKWYRGFNMYYDKEVTYPDGSTKVIRALAGPDYEKKDYYIQIW